MGNGKNFITAEEAARIGAAAGAKAAMEAIEAERTEREKRMQRERRELPARRKANVKLLLRNYRALKEHAENAVYDAADCESPVEILEDMMQGRDYSVKVESIMNSAARTALMVEHVKTMLELFHTYCRDKNTPTWDRRWVVINKLYLQDDQTSVPELAYEYGTVEQSIYNDIDVACERIAAFMFGIDGLALNAERKRRGKERAEQ